MSGYKTYIAGIAAILTGVAGFLKGGVQLPDLIEIVSTALIGMGIRHGVTTEAAKKE